MSTRIDWTDVAFHIMFEMRALRVCGHGDTGVGQ
jgi:hypothetical protein